MLQILELFILQFWNMWQIQLLVHMLILLVHKLVCVCYMHRMIKENDTKYMTIYLYTCIHGVKIGFT